jgi:hypothetical protein
MGDDVAINQLPTESLSARFVRPDDRHVRALGSRGTAPRRGRG